MDGDCPRCAEYRTLLNRLLAERQQWRVPVCRPYLFRWRSRPLPDAGGPK